MLRDCNTIKNRTNPRHGGDFSSLLNKFPVSDQCWHASPVAGSEVLMTKAATPFMRSHYQCGCVMLINRINTEAGVLLLLCGCVCITNALLM